MAVTTLQIPAKPRAARRPRPPGYASQMTFVATGLIPILALFAIFAFAPVGIVLWLSLHKYNQLAPVRPFIGTRNFEFAFKRPALHQFAHRYAEVRVGRRAVEPDHRPADRHGLIQVTRLRAVFRSAFFLPTVASAVAVSLIWRYVYEPQTGILNAALAALHLPQPSWLADPATALWAILITAVWQDLGYNILILLAGLQTIPDDFYDAAKVDGAGAWPRFKDVTVPLLSRTLLFVSVLTMISYLQQFTYVQVMPSNPGGPINSTSTLVFYIYTKAFSNMQLGYASAVSVVLMVIILIITLFQLLAALALGVLTMEEALPDRAPSAPGKGIGEGVLIAIFAVVTIIFIMPLVMMVFSAFKPTAEILRVPPTFFPEAPTLNNFRTVLTEAPYGLWYRNSLVVASAVTALAVFTSAVGGYIFAKFEFPLKQPLFVLILITLMIPFPVLLIPNYIIANRLGVLNSLWALILPGMVSAFGIFATASSPPGFRVT